jgi:hypothetical protein
MTATLDPPTDTDAEPKKTRRWRSRIRHGLCSRELPIENGSSIAEYRDRYRRAIENELLDLKADQQITDDLVAKIGPTEAKVVAAAVAWYEHFLKASYWLSKHDTEMSLDQRLAFSRDAARGLGEAAKLLKTLGIDRKPDDADEWGGLTVDWHAIDAQDAATEPPEPTTIQTATSAQMPTDATLGPLNDAELADEILRSDI